MKNMLIFRVIIYITILLVCLGGIFSSVLNITFNGLSFSFSPFRLMMSCLSFSTFILLVFMQIKITLNHTWFDRLRSRSLSITKDDGFTYLFTLFFGFILIICGYYSIISLILPNDGIFTTIKVVMNSWLPAILWLISISLQTLLSLSILRIGYITNSDTFKLKIKDQWPALYYFGILLASLMVGLINGIISIKSVIEVIKIILDNVNTISIIMGKYIYPLLFTSITILFVLIFLGLRKKITVTILSKTFSAIDGILLGLSWVIIISIYWEAGKIGLMFFLLILLYGPLLFAFRSRIWVNSTILILFIFGIFLLLNNFVGLFIPLAAPQVLSLNRDLNPIFPSLIRKEGKLNGEYIQRVNQLIHYAMRHGSSPPIPIYKNYLLYMYLGTTHGYEFCNYQKAIERGIGLCSQQSLIAATILADNGIATKRIRLSGHVVVSAEVDPSKGIWWIVDPDYGVIIDHSIEQIEKDPNFIKPYYQLKGYDNTNISSLVSIYDKKGNSVDSFLPSEYHSCQLENETYILISVHSLKCI